MSIICNTFSDSQNGDDILVYCEYSPSSSEKKESEIPAQCKVSNLPDLENEKEKYTINAYYVDRDYTIIYKESQLKLNPPYGIWHSHPILISYNPGTFTWTLIALEKNSHVTANPLESESKSIIFKPNENDKNSYIISYDDKNRVLVIKTCYYSAIIVRQPNVDIEIGPKVNNQYY